MSIDELSQLIINGSNSVYIANIPTRRENNLELISGNVNEMLMKCQGYRNGFIRRMRQ